MPQPASHAAQGAMAGFGDGMCRMQPGGAQKVRSLQVQIRDDARVVGELWTSLCTKEGGKQWLTMRKNTESYGIG